MTNSKNDQLQNDSRKKILPYKMTDKQNDPLTMRLAARWTFARMTNCQNESAFHAKIKHALTGWG